MRQTLFHIPLEIGPLPLFGLGWLLIAWAAFSLLLLLWLVRRQGFNSDTIGYLPLLAMVGIVIAVVLPWLTEDAGLPIRGYGAMLLVAVLSGVGLAAWRARRIGVDPEIIYSLALWLFVAGIVGARAFYVVEYWDDYRKPTVTETIKSVINVTQGGLVVFGAAIGAGLALVLFVRKHALPGLALADLIAPSLMLGLALGRIGCFLNGCCFGGVCSLPWAVTFPQKSPPHLQQVEQRQIYLHGLKLVDSPGLPALVESVEPGSAAERAGMKQGQEIVRIHSGNIDVRVETVGEAQNALLSISGIGRRVSVFTADDRAQPKRWALPQRPERSLPVHPAQLYSSIDALLLCLFLLAWYPYRRRDGEVLALLVTLHPVSRFLLEIVRTDESAVFGTGLSISQNLSLAMLAGAAVLWWIVSNRPRHLEWIPQVRHA